MQQEPLCHHADFDGRKNHQGMTAADLEIHPPIGSRLILGGCRGCGSRIDADVAVSPMSG
jgi:hypothetical protein